MKKFIRKIALLFGSGRAAPATAFEEAYTAYTDGDFEKARRLLLPLAESGDAAAQSVLSAMYKLGQGVPQDNTVAARWIRLAAERSNFPGFQRAVALNYLQGDGERQS